MDKLAEDYKKLIENGSRLRRAKLFNNVIRPALLPVPIEDVCIPALHLHLGIDMWLFEAMVSDLRLLDMAMARQLGQSATAETDGQMFAEAVQLSSELAEKENLEETQVQAQLFEAQVKVSHSRAE